ncbi:hypothetical protein [Ideonella dechloratans]|uniref:hypothetical protein n=1 Tax=Ideonella dechloratans TaxID=36863 RepID=UPI001E64E382|nr:hypothetical protein [Ideonella dechloratans]
MTLLLSKIAALATWLGELAVAAFTAFWLMLTDVLVWSFDAFLGLAVTLVGSIDLGGLTAYTADWAGLPPSTIEAMQAVGLSSAVGIVAVAIGVRVLLQLIPFVRLGS